MGQLTQTDLQLVISRIPRDLRNLVQTNGLIVAGGFIRETIAGNKPNDVDVFGPSANAQLVAADVLNLNRPGSKLHKSANAISIFAPPRMPVQFITRWTFSNPEDCVDSFDFTVCQAAVWYSASYWHSEISDDFYSDLAARRLVYTSPRREEEPGGSLLRVRKFLTRGYNIQAESLAAVVARIMVGTRVLASGVDELTVTTAVKAKLREVDPLVTIDGLDPVDEHEAIGI